MALQVGFARVDISPVTFPVRTYLGCVNAVTDPIYANAAFFVNGEESFAVVSVDVVIVEWEYVRRIREAVTAGCGLPGHRLLVCATHNHACPAVVERPGHGKEHGYLDRLVERTAMAVIRARTALTPATLAAGRTLEARISRNRRFILRDGSVSSQPGPAADILCSEGPIDPEVGVVGIGAPGGGWRGVLVNFACHACHLMGQVSAGYPGVLRRRLQERYGPDFAVVFLNGACGNLIHTDYLDRGADFSLERVGGLLADDVAGVLDTLTDAAPDPVLRAAEGTVGIGFRDWSALADPARLVNVFPFLIDLGWYAASHEYLRELTAAHDHLVATQQAFRLGDVVFATVPAEYFTENGLYIKEHSPVPRTFVVSLANGWLGYVPHPEAFDRPGGHETNPALWSKMERNAGRILANRALDLVAKVS